MLTLSPLSFAAEKAAQAPVSSSPLSTSTMIFQVLIALGIVTAAILALAWMAKRLGNTHLLQQRDLKVLSTMSLGTREKIVLIEVEKQKILLGVTPTNISSLHVFDSSQSGEVEISSKDANVETSPEKWDFTRYFKKVIRDGQPHGQSHEQREDSSEGSRE